MEQQQKESESPFEEELQSLSPDDAKKEISNINNQVEKDEEDNKNNNNNEDEEESAPRGAPVKKSKEKPTKIDINSDFHMGKQIPQTDSNLDIISRGPEDDGIDKATIKHILTYQDDSSEEKKQDFPFHAERIQIID